MTVSEPARQLAIVAAQAADEKSAANIAALDVSDVLGISDVFVIASADNERAVKAIVDEIEEAMTGQGEKPIRREGHRDYRWVLLDYGQIVVHVQREDEREFYGLDRLYGDCDVIAVDGIEPYQRTGSYQDDSQVRSAEKIEDIPLAQGDPS